MPTITVFVPAGTIVAAVDGDPPVDQSTLVTKLQGQITAITAKMDLLDTDDTNADQHRADIRTILAS